MSSPLRVLRVTASVAPRDGGPSTGVLELSRELRQLGVHDQVVSTDADGPVARLDHARFAAAHPDLDLVLTRVHAPRRLKASRELRRQVRAHLGNVDVVHIHGHYLYATAVTARLARRAGVPYVVQPHGVLEPYQRRTGRWRKLAFDRVVSRGYLQRAAAVLFATDSEQSAAGDLVRPDQSFVLPLGARLPDVPGGFVPSWSRPDDEGRPTVAFVGRLARKKRLDLLLQAWAEVMGSIDGALLLVAGEGEVEQARALIVELGLHDSVRLLGHVSGPDKTALYERADAFVLVSENENFAVSVAESCAAGTPVVISDRVALHTLVSRHEAGIVVTEVSASATATALIAVLGDPARREQLASGARAAWEQELQWSRTAKAAIAVYAFVSGLGPDPRR